MSITQLQFRPVTLVQFRMVITSPCGRDSIEFRDAGDHFLINGQAATIEHAHEYFDYYFWSCDYR